MVLNESSSSYLQVPTKSYYSIKRSNKWPALRKKWLKLNPSCQICGAKLSLQVHHIIPVHINPELELEQTNLMTLCEGTKRQCHFIFGHLYDWDNYNEDIRIDAPIWLAKNWTTCPIK